MMALPPFRVERSDQGVRAQVDHDVGAVAAKTRISAELDAESDGEAVRIASDPAAAANALRGDGAPAWAGQVAYSHDGLAHRHSHGAAITARCTRTAVAGQIEADATAGPAAAADALDHCAVGIRAGGAQLRDIVGIAQGQGNAAPAPALPPSPPSSVIDPWAPAPRPPAPPRDCTSTAWPPTTF